MHVFTGDYICSAVNLVGSDEAEVSLHVVGESISWAQLLLVSFTKHRNFVNRDALVHLIELNVLKYIINL